MIGRQGPSTDSSAYAWLVTGASFILMGATWGAQGSYGAFVNPLTEQMGWSRTEVSAAFSVLTIVNFTVGVLWGLVADRWGVRWVVVTAGLIMGLGVFLTGTATAIWHLYIFYGVIAGIGLGGLVGPISAIIARWFDRRRGLALSIAYAGLGSGTAGLPILAEHLSSTFGWRAGFWGLGAIIWVTVVLCGIVFREPKGAPGSPEADTGGGDPASAKGTPTGGANRARAQPASVSLTSAARSRTFWIMLGMELCATVVFFMVMVHLAARATDTGISTATAVTLLSVIGLVNMVSQVAGGLLGDRFGPRLIFAGGMVVCTAAVVWLIFSSTLGMFYIFAAAFGLGTGVWSPQVPSMIARVFGTRHIAAIWGAVLIGAGIGGLIGPTVAGYVFDTTASYRIAFTIGAGFGAMGVILSLVLSDKPLEVDRTTRRA